MRSHKYSCSTKASRVTKTSLRVEASRVAKNQLMKVEKNPLMTEASLVTKTSVMTEATRIYRINKVRFWNTGWSFCYTFWLFGSTTWSTKTLMIAISLDGLSGISQIYIVNYFLTHFSKKKTMKNKRDFKS